MDCPWDIFYLRARLKGFVVHLLKEQQRRRENAIRSSLVRIIEEKARGVVVVVLSLVGVKVFFY